VSSKQENCGKEGQVDYGARRRALTLARKVWDRSPDLGANVAHGRGQRQPSVKKHNYGKEKTSRSKRIKRGLLMMQSQGAQFRRESLTNKTKIIDYWRRGSDGQRAELNRTKRTRRFAASLMSADRH